MIFSKSKFGGKYDNFGKNKTKKITPRGSWGSLFQLQGPGHLEVPGRHTVPSGVVVRIVEGKSRAEALNTAVPRSQREMSSSQLSFILITRQTTWLAWQLTSTAKQRATLL